MVAKVCFEYDGGRVSQDVIGKFFDLFELAKDYLGDLGAKPEWWSDSAKGLFGMVFSCLDMAQAQDVLEMFLGDAYSLIDKAARDAHFYVKKVEFSEI